jgi:hypothetical protein
MGGRVFRMGRPFESAWIPVIAMAGEMDSCRTMTLLFMGIPALYSGTHEPERPPHRQDTG